jgi:nucleoside phosphorylase
VQVVPLDSVRRSIDFGIITFREDEFEAVLDQFRPKWLARGERRYNIAEILTTSGKRYHCAIVRAYQQGQSDAQHAASHLISELDPSCLVLIGIAGAKPESEFSLGDVIVATRLHDFSVRAQQAGGDVELTNTGGPIHSLVQTAIANLPAEKSLLGNWNSEEAIGKPLPLVDLADENFLGDDAWKKKVKQALAHRFGSPHNHRQPLVTGAALAAANVLMKDPALLQNWLEHARDLKAVEMELPGVYAAARSVGGDRPVLAIRGISDVVGFKRDSAWTEYACRSAASFAHAYLTAELLGMDPKTADKAMSALTVASELKIVECAVMQPEGEAQVMFRLTLENRSERVINLHGLRLHVVKIWDIPKYLTSRQDPLPDPDLPRLNIPAKADTQAKLPLSEVVNPGTTTVLSCNLFSRDAKNRQIDIPAFGEPYGLNLFHLKPSLVTDSGELELPPLLVHLHGFGSFSEYPLPAQLNFGPYIDEVAEALNVIRNGAVADPVLQTHLHELIEAYRRNLARDSSSKR